MVIILKIERMHLFDLDKSAIQNNNKKTNSLRLFLAGCPLNIFCLFSYLKKYRYEIFSDRLSSNIIILYDVTACSRNFPTFGGDIQSECLPDHSVTSQKTETVEKHPCAERNSSVMSLRLDILIACL
jgi:hypothetical protein